MVTKIFLTVSIMVNLAIGGVLWFQYSSYSSIFGLVGGSLGERLTAGLLNPKVAGDLIDAGEKGIGALWTAHRENAERRYENRLGAKDAEIERLENQIERERRQMSILAKIADKQRRELMDSEAVAQHFITALENVPSSSVVGAKCIAANEAVEPYILQNIADARSKASTDG